MHAAPWATWGLLGAWALHDLEEGVAFPAWTAARADALERSGMPRAARVLRRTPAEGWLAIGLMAVPFAVAAARGARSGGADAVYRGVLDAYGAHAISHVGASAVTRSYTPGVITAVPLVAGFWTLARAELRRAEVPAPTRLVALAAALAIAAWTPACHAIARRLLRARSR